MGRQTGILLVVALFVLAGCSESPTEPLLGATATRPIDGMQLVYVPAGQFQMGSSSEEIQDAFELCKRYWGNCDLERFHDEQPRHRVILDGFWIDRTEVTNRQYRMCVDSGYCQEPACWRGPQFNAPEQPVVCVSWYQAEAYCEWIGGRLPTEAEWEYAARGPKGVRYPWGNPFVGDRLNYCDATCGRPRSDAEWNDGQLYSAPPGQYPAGATWCGALDMAGNVSEWVADWYGNYSPDRQVNPTGPSEGFLRAIRGGSWFLTRAETRTVWREGLPPSAWFDDLGFRCVMPKRE